MDNFCINKKIKNDLVYLKVYGELNGTSALKLLRELKEYRWNKNRVIVNCCNLNKLHNFGKTIFKTHIKYIMEENSRIRFIGKNSKLLTAF